MISKRELLWVLLGAVLGAAAQDVIGSWQEKPAPRALPPFTAWCMPTPATQEVLLGYREFVRCQEHDPESAVARCNGLLATVLQRVDAMTREINQ